MKLQIHIKNITNIEKHYKTIIYIMCFLFSSTLFSQQELILQSDNSNEEKRFTFDNANKTTNLPLLYVDKNVFQSNFLKEVVELSNPSKEEYNLFTHGRSGELFINDKWLQKEEIAVFVRQQLTTNNQQVTTLNIYGCEFAKGEKGKEAVKYLENKLGLSIAASTNITGVDGDWILEVGNHRKLEFHDYKYNLQDTDGDGVPDSVDIDDDNDGILDTVENTILSLFENSNFNIPPSYENPYTSAISGFVPSPWSSIVTPDISTDTEIDFNGVTFNRTTLTPTFNSSPSGGSFIGFRSAINVTGGGVPLRTHEGITSAITISDASEEMTLSLYYTEYTQPGNASDPIKNEIRINSTSFNNGTLLYDIPTLADSGGVEGTWEIRTTTFIPQDYGIVDGQIVDFYIGANDHVSTFPPLTVLFSNTWIFVDDIFINETALGDLDKDTIESSLDLDADNDGIADIYEHGNSTVASYDTNGNGTIELSEGFVDNGSLANSNAGNGLDDRIENLIGTADTGVTPVNSFNAGSGTSADFLNLDSDDDGIPDAIEARATTDYISYPATIDDAADSDDDGILDIFDDTVGFGSTLVGFKTGLRTPNADGNDTADTIPDYLDLDADGDGNTDADESNLTIISGVAYEDPDGNINNPLSNVDGSILMENTDLDSSDVDFRSVDDTDGDGLADTIDIDDDNDGILDTQELCNNSGTPFANSIITVEFDFDGWSEEISWSLTGPAGATGLPTNISYGGNLRTASQDYTATVAGTYVLTVNDSFGDGMSDNSNGEDTASGAISFIRVLVDGVEVYDTLDLFGNYHNFGTTINTGSSIVISTKTFSCVNADPSGDDDGDGTPNYQDADFVTGVVGDTLNASGTWSSLDQDGDGVPDHLDLDSDNDGIADIYEAGNTIVAGYDTNGNGTIEPSESYVDDGSLANSTAGNGLDDRIENLIGITDAGVTPVDSFDTAADSLADFLDLDSDDDGIPDAIEARATTDYIAYPTTIDDSADSDDDGILDIFDDTVGFGSTLADFKTGLRIPNADTSDTTDTIPDYLDLDSDGDGLTDTDESNLTTISGVSYADPDGNINDPLNDTDGSILMENTDLNNSDVDFRSLDIANVIISQVYENGGNTVIELTNLSGTTITAGNINLVFFSNTSGDQTGVIPTATYTVVGALAPNQSVLIESSGFTGANINNSPIREINAGVTGFSGGDDLIVLSSTTNNTAWANRIDVVENITNTSSIVRNDDIITSNTTFTTSEWT
uniref:DUF4347 domain-containing protein n=1 Tax=Kordia sp. TaxID=1965332 RepID=UPI003D6A0B69